MIIYSPFLAFIVDRLPTNKINDTTKIILNTNRNLDCCRWYPQLRANLVNHTPGICTRTEVEAKLETAYQHKRYIITYRSILLMNDIRGTLYRRICRSTVVV